MSSLMLRLGIYEKALVSGDDWGRLFADARRAGFGFMDLSIDESPGRQARLQWSSRARSRLVEASRLEGLGLGGICLSAHRRTAPASADKAVRDKALDMLFRAVDLCVDLGVPLLQLAGYYAYYEPPSPQAPSWFEEFLADSADYAALAGVMLGLENVDTSGITSITAGVRVLGRVNKAYLGLYPDVGNLTEQRLDTVSELAAGAGRMLAIHVKDARPGQARRVPMGEGLTPWEAAFSELYRQRWSGRMLIEMWNDDSPDSVEVCARAREFITKRLLAAGFSVDGGL